MIYGQNHKDRDEHAGRKGVVALLVLCAVIGGGIWLARKESSGEVKGVFTPVVEKVIVQSPTPIPIDNKTQQFVKSLQEVTATMSGVYAVWVERIESKEIYGFNVDAQVNGASLLKIPAMVALLGKIEDGELSTSSAYPLTEADRSMGSGPLQYKPAGTLVTVEDLIRLMGQNSDNTAWRMVNRIVGRDTVTEVLRTMGLTQTSYEDFNTTTADMGKMFVQLEVGNLLSPAGKNRLYGYLQDSIYEDRISLAMPKNIAVIHKVATLDDAWEDVALIRCKEDIEGGCGVRPFVLAILNVGVDRDEAAQIVPEIARRVLGFEQVQAAE